MAYLLDTNVVSELRKKSRAHPNVKRWQSNQPSWEQWISVISLMEVRIGVVRALKTDPSFAEILDEWYRSQLVPAYSGRILFVDLITAEKRAEFEKQRTLSYSDALIAATAATRGMIVVTRNISDFAGLGIDLVNPWEYENE